MKITDIILDYILDTKLFEMAFRRKKILNDLLHQSGILSEHLVKLLMYPSSQSHDHWVGEVDGWLRKTQRQKTKNKKRLDKGVYFYYFFTGPFETFEEVQDYMNDIYREYSDLTIEEPDARIIHKKLHDITTQLSYDISKGKFESIKDYL